MTVTSWVANAERALAKVGVLSARLDAELLLATAISVEKNKPVDRSHIHSLSDVTLGKETIALANALLERRKNREPLAYIVEQKEFYGREFAINDSVLIPRPETETIIEIVKLLPVRNPRIADVGTGSGVIGITLALEIPNAKVSLGDISSAALEVTAYNMRLHGVGGKVVQSNLMKDFRGTYDLIIANLPYVDRSWEVSPETAFEPDRALYAGDEGLFYIKKLLQEVPTKLSRNGLVILEADERQHERLISFAKRNDFDHRLTKGLILVFSLSKDVAKAVNSNRISVAKK
ncbi:peptide chain release factor N(5)-glutamine methyltransferase [Candidatus Saccharibacteria bacterium]|nr:peptide chain release factor N(5)-glutamine methyltransferase [Candidatus Saccharibacteria bacterium]